LTAYFWQIEFFGTMASVAFIPIAMRLCDPRVAATQFTLFMAASNVGRPMGNSIAAAADEAGSPQIMYFVIGGVFAVLALIMRFARFPSCAPEIEELIEAAQPVQPDEPAPPIN
jgi:MFS transporter, PAT family, beta-lactamase induction signal transducer AmpG